MSSPKLPREQLHRAVEIYMAHAYTGPPPSGVRSKVDTLRSLPEDELLSSPVFERDHLAPSGKLSVRLGNRLYPHMKLTIERSPDQMSFLFRADTHDRHINLQPGSRDYAEFAKLMSMNQELAQAIETAWADAHLPTFKTYLREDLSRRALAAPPEPKL